MKKLFKFSMMCLMASPFFTGCGKDSETNGNGGNTEPTQQRIEEFIYDYDLNFWREGSSSKIPYSVFGDTAAKYGADQNIKRIHITPESPNMCSTLNGTKMQTRANIFNDIYEQSENKLSGENTTLYLSSDAFANQIVQQIIHNKLQIELIEK